MGISFTECSVVLEDVLVDPVVVEEGEVGIGVLYPQVLDLGVEHGAVEVGELVVRLVATVGIFGAVSSGKYERNASERRDADVQEVPGTGRVQCLGTSRREWNHQGVIRLYIC
jgi:hypothetical protein